MAWCRRKLRNLKTGTQTEHRFRSEDRVDRATLEQHEMEFLYDSDGHYHFMNTETYDQIALDRETLGDAVNYLTPNCAHPDRVLRHDADRREPAEDRRPEDRRDRPGASRRATVTNVLKPATLETGLIVQVPNFVNEGDLIRVDTETGAYLSRAKSE